MTGLRADRTRSRLGAQVAITRRSLLDAKALTLGAGAIFAVYAYAQVAGYRNLYPTLTDRLGYAHSFSDNKALRLLFGVPHQLQTLGGYATWRTAGLMSIFAAVFGALVAIRALRRDEDVGRRELILANPVGRRRALSAVLVAVGLSVAVLWLATFAGLLIGGLAVGGSAYLALVTVSPAVVFAGVSALAAQLAPTARHAARLVLGVLVVSLMLRAVADTANGTGWLDWLTPLGWAELLRAFDDPRPWVLIIVLAATALPLIAAIVIDAGRDLGTGLLRSTDTAAPNPVLLGSPTAQALRDQAGTIASWLVAIALFALTVGLMSSAFSGRTITANVQRELHKIDGADLTTPRGGIGFYFLLFVFVISLFACSQLAAARREEAEQRLETLLALPTGRQGWLAGRIILTALAAAALALTAGVFSWIGATLQSVDIPLPALLEAALNCLPVTLLFLGLATLAFAALPRASAGISSTLVTVAFLWQIVGSLLNPPQWLLDATPFQHIGLVPAQPFRTTAAIITLAIGATAAAAGVLVFKHRDLITD